MRVNPAPTITKMFVRSMHFHLPMPRSGPEKRAPTADPAVVRLCENAYLLLASSSPHCCLYLYASKAVFHDPMEYPNWIVPILTVINRKKR